MLCCCGRESEAESGGHLATHSTTPACSPACLPANPCPRPLQPRNFRPCAEPAGERAAPWPAVDPRHSDPGPARRGGPCCQGRAQGERRGYVSSGRVVGESRRKEGSVFGGVLHALPALPAPAGEHALCSCRQYQNLKSTALPPLPPVLPAGTLWPTSTSRGCLG